MPEDIELSHLIDMIECYREVRRQRENDKGEGSPDSEYSEFLFSLESDAIKNLGSALRSIIRSEALKPTVPQSPVSG